MEAEGFEPIEYDSRTVGWFWVPEPNESIVVLFHGNGENALEYASAFDDLLQPFAAAIGLAEYRGYMGGDEALPSRSDELIDDGVALAKTFQSDAGARGCPIVLWGRSLGGAVAAELARDSS